MSNASTGGEGDPSAATPSVEETVTPRRRVDMHPTLMREIGRERHADLLREAERSRLAHAAVTWGDEGARPRSARRRRFARTLRPVLGR